MNLEYQSLNCDDYVYLLSSHHESLWPATAPKGAVVTIAVVCSGCTCFDELSLRIRTRVGFIPLKRRYIQRSAGVQAVSPRQEASQWAFCFFRRFFTLFYSEDGGVNSKQQTQEVTLGAHHSPLSSVCFFLSLFLNGKHSLSCVFSSTNLSTLKLYIYFFTFNRSFF